MSAPISPDADFAPHVKAGRIIRAQEIIPRPPYDMRYLFFALPGEEWRIEEALVIVRNLCAGTVTDHDADSARMGGVAGVFARRHRNIPSARKKRRESRIIKGDCSLFTAEESNFLDQFDIVQLDQPTATSM